MAECYGCKFKAGDLRHRITIQTPSLTQDSSGASNTTWSNFAVVWAACEVKSGSERLIAQRIDAEDIYTLTLRFIPGVQEKMRILLGSRILQIKSAVDPNERRQWLQIKAVDEGDGT